MVSSLNGSASNMAGGTWNEHGSMTGIGAGIAVTPPEEGYLMEESPAFRSNDNFATEKLPPTGPNSQFS